MSIPFPKTWTGEVLTASDMQGNLDAIKAGHHKMNSSDFLSGSKWVDTKHIVVPDYNGFTNMQEGVSGVFGGKNSGGFFHKMTYMTRWQSGSSGNVDSFIPHTAFTLDLLRPCSIFFQWWASVLSPTDGDGTMGDSIITPYVYNLQSVVNGIGAHHPEQPNASSLDALIDGCHQSNGFMMIEQNNEQFQWGIGLRGKSTAGKATLISWGVSIEAFYI